MKTLLNFFKKRRNYVDIYRIRDIRASEKSFYQNIMAFGDKALEKLKEQATTEISKILPKGERVERMACM
ncbi:MAG: hypothetical protein PF637_11115 [Spirochaetes bacterium]|jgi:hypothetical protein|nr:hypothetical protein [Spirochaetota bacterium]